MDDGPLEITGEFLSTLVAAAVRYGNSGDSVEVYEFVRYCFWEAGIEPPADLDWLITESDQYVADDQTRLL